MNKKQDDPSGDKSRYAAAGVNIDAGNALVERIKPFCKATYRPGVLGDLGGYGGMFELPVERYKRPVLVSSTDGVGTKLKLAIESGQHSGVGIDLVAMCANDVVVCGAEPLFFLDYYATGKLEVAVAAQVVESIATGCRMANIALIGGETAEMPGMYQQDDYDLAGFCVGIVEKDHIIDGSHIEAGNAIIGLASSGIHSNGFSLVRQLLLNTGTSIHADFQGKTWADILLTPTKIYVTSILALARQVPILGMAHITGGGFIDNIPRILPAGLAAVLTRENWHEPAIFAWLRQQGAISSDEMYRTFNCGIGMVVVVPASALNTALTGLQQLGETAWHIGTIMPLLHQDEPVRIQ